MFKQVEPSPCHRLTFVIEQGHQRETFGLAHLYVFSYSRFSLLTLSWIESLQVQAHITCVTKDMPQSFFPLTDTQIVFSLVYRETRLRPCHLLRFLPRKLYTHAISINPYAGTPVFVRQDKHEQKYSKGDKPQDIRKYPQTFQACRQRMDGGKEYEQGRYCQ